MYEISLKNEKLDHLKPIMRVLELFLPKISLFTKIEDD